MWKDELSIEAFPFDAGFEDGLTFTAPVWKSDYLMPVKRITSKEPNHGAASFFYPELQTLPPIGFYSFKKVLDLSLMIV